VKKKERYTPRDLGGKDMKIKRTKSLYPTMICHPKYNRIYRDDTTHPTNSFPCSSLLKYIHGRHREHESKSGKLVI